MTHAIKKAIIFHGTGNNSQGNWLPWLKKQLEVKGWQVWSPDLPDADRPDIKRYLAYIEKNMPFVADAQTTLIGHSSGATAGLGWLQSLPNNIMIDQAILISSFHTDLGWEKLGGLFSIPLDFNRIKTKAKKFIFVHSDNDPYVDLSEAEFLAEKMSGELRLIKGQGHFNLETSPKYKEFPKLLAIIVKESKPSLAHTALSVKNLVVTQRFFEVVFEMTELSRGERKENGIKFINLIDINGQGIEIFEHVSPISITDDRDMMDFSTVGYKHVCFRVDSIEKTMKKALDNGAKVLWDIRPGVTVKKIAFIADPNDLPIELVEMQ
ncbi:MAG: alpha/beta hydrolase [Pseudomonadales bacterium]|jgi:predicted alpha/beta hydrolase family esterase/catechol 2,3-dioxygenase-like lactoylglutathione lyase family enzyme|nr:alpha/beta hydrolase [Pseudomonadales bacterium]